MSDAAFDRLVHLHRMPLERYTRGLGASREDAEEIAATALLRAYQEPAASSYEREWRPWLATVARNLYVDARRRRQLRLVSGDDVLASVASPSAPVDQVAATAQEARQICSAIALLPPTQRAAIYLREVRGLSYEEISAELGITQRAVTTTLERAREILKRRRPGLAHSLSAVSFAPLALYHRAGRLLHGGFSASAAKLTVPVLLAATAGAGTLAVVHEHPWSASPARIPGAAPARSAVAGETSRIVSARTSAPAVVSRGAVPDTTPQPEQTPPAAAAPATSPLASSQAPAGGHSGTAPAQPSEAAGTPDAAGPPGGAPPAVKKNPGPATPPRRTPNEHANARAKDAVSSAHGAKGARASEAGQARKARATAAAAGKPAGAAAAGKTTGAAAAGKSASAAAAGKAAGAAAAGRASSQGAATTRAATAPPAPRSSAGAAAPATPPAGPPADSGPPAATGPAQVPAGTPAGSPPVDPGQGGAEPHTAPGQQPGKDAPPGRSGKAA